MVGFLVGQWRTQLLSPLMLMQVRIIAILNVLKCTKELNFSGDCDEGVLCNNDVSVGPAEDGDCLAHLPRALGTLPLQGAGLLQLGGGMYRCR